MSEVDEAHWAREKLRLKVAAIPGGSLDSDHDIMVAADAYAAASGRDAVEELIEKFRPPLMEVIRL